MQGRSKDWPLFLGRFLRHEEWVNAPAKPRAEALGNKISHSFPETSNAA